MTGSPGAPADILRPDALRGSEIIGEIKKAGVEFVVALPDIVTSDGLLWPISRDPELRLLRICREDEGVAICAAMSYNDTRALLMMQQTGLMDSLNAVRAIGMDYLLPVVMMVGLQGKEEDLVPEESASYGVRITRPVLDAMGVSHSMVSGQGDAVGISRHIDRAYRQSRPHIFLIGKSPVAS